jgi:exonuclease III
LAPLSGLPFAPSTCDRLSVPAHERVAAYQLDHLFVDATTLATCRGVTIDAEVLDNVLSDHAPIVAEFDLGS